MLKFSETLKKNYEFRRLYSKGKSAATPVLVVYCRRTKRAYNRIGITVTNKVGKAVHRNRVRRRIREIYRLNEYRLLPGTDLVVVARVTACQSSGMEPEHSQNAADSTDFRRR